MRKVNLKNVKDGMVTAKPVLGFLGQVLLNADMEIKEKHIYYLKRMGIDSIYVCDSNIKTKVNDPISDETRSESRALVGQVMKDLDSPNPLKKGIMFNEKEVLSIVSRIVEELISNREVLFQLTDIRAKDGYLFAHSVNCCVIATMIGVKMNYDRNTLKILATGSLLHDIGLIIVPQIILKKAGSLSSSEFNKVKEHPRYGYEIFKKTKIYSERAAEVILQHHERNFGQGYPLGLQGKEIASLARIMIVADVYDALTSEKTYRDAYPVHEALDIMIAQGGECFDLDVLNIFLENVSAYPVGTIVKLSNGEIGMVTANSPGYSLRPVIRVLYKNDLSDHPAPFDLDLKKALELTVDDIVDESVFKNK